MKEQQVQALEFIYIWNCKIYQIILGYFIGEKEIYTNPADFLGIPNQEGISAFYDGVPIPTPTDKRRNNFNWVLYANKLRKRSNKLGRKNYV